MANFLLLKIMLVGREFVRSAVMCESCDVIRRSPSEISRALVCFAVQRHHEIEMQRDCDSFQLAVSKLAPTQGFFSVLSLFV